MTTVESETEIDADPEAVWNVLTTVDAYGEWNPLVTSVEGSIGDDEQLRVTFEPRSGRSVTLRARVKVFEPAGRLVWIGRYFLPNLLDTRHEFIIEPSPDGVRFLQRGTFVGALVPILLSRDAVRDGFEASNEALKKRVERA